MFYILESPRLSKITEITDFIEAEPMSIGEALKCDLCGEFISMLPWHPPYRAIIEIYGSTFGDIAFGTGGSLLISDKFKDIIEKFNIIGFEGFEPVEILSVKGKKTIECSIPRYYHVSVKYSNSVINDEKCGLVRAASAPICPKCHLGGEIKRFKRVVIEESSWEGEDIFIPRGIRNLKVVSERFHDIIRKHELSQVNLIPAEEYGEDFYPWEN